MATLADERIRRLHKWFLDAAERYGFVRCAAIRREGGDRLSEKAWCRLLDKHGRYGLPLAFFGVSNEAWCGLLVAPRGCSTICGQWIPILIDGRAWAASCYVQSNYWRPLPKKVAAVNRAAQKVKDLAVRAAAEFELGSAGTSEDDRGGAWLEALLATTGVERRKTDEGVFLIRETDNFFAASARAMAILEHPAAVATNPARKRRSGRKPTTKALARFANTRRKRNPPTTWRDIAVEYLVAHPQATNENGNQLTRDDVRGAWRREYGDKKPKSRERPAPRKPQNI